MQEKIKKLIKKNFLLIIAVIIGAVFGYFYWEYVGCNFGTCAITPSPLNSSLYGGLMGGLFAGLFKKEKNNKTE